MRWVLMASEGDTTTLTPVTWLQSIPQVLQGLVLRCCNDLPSRCDAPDPAPRSPGSCEPPVLDSRLNADLPALHAPSGERPRR
jgi:hypothetical protein